LRCFPLFTNVFFTQWFILWRRITRRTFFSLYWNYVHHTCARDVRLLTSLFFFFPRPFLSSSFAAPSLCSLAPSNAAFCTASGTAFLEHQPSLEAKKQSRAGKTKGQQQKKNAAFVSLYLAAPHERVGFFFFFHSWGESEGRFPKQDCSVIKAISSFLRSPFSHVSARNTAPHFHDIGFFCAWSLSDTSCSLNCSLCLLALSFLSVFLFFFFFYVGFSSWPDCFLWSFRVVTVTCIDIQPAQTSQLQLRFCF
jgi:hypothetical protein